jgi:hypothetical protein
MPQGADLQRADAIHPPTDVGIDARLDVRPVAGMGRGVFAAAAIPAGTLLGTFHTIALSAADVTAARGTTLSDYWFEDDADGSAVIVLGVMELVNHSLRPNVDRRWRVTAAGEVVELYAVCDIAAGAQLFLDYRFDGRPDDPPWARDGATEGAEQAAP